MQVTFHDTRCAICGVEGNADELYPANFDAGAFTAEVFSARRLPDRIHYRMVRCKNCGLVRSDPVADTAALFELYRQSTFEYGHEVENLKRSYGRYLKGLEDFGVRKDALLEVGCGNGFFLEEALRQGYRTVKGVEPGLATVAAAPDSVRPDIVPDVMRAGLFPPATFDVVCLFQVFDHIPDPGGLLDECFNALRPGGFLLCLNHNIGSLSARLLKERSPIIDIEHTYLYSMDTIGHIARDHGFQVCRTGVVSNSYSVSYLTRLVPMPKGLKKVVLGALDATRIGRVRARAKLGNLYMIARKPEAI